MPDTIASPPPAPALPVVQVRLPLSSEDRLDQLEIRVDGIEARIATNHTEVLARIDSKSGQLSNESLVKLLAAGALLLTSLAGIGNALAPVLPDVLRARYAQPAVVVTVAPPTSAAPALSR